MCRKYGNNFPFYSNKGELKMSTFLGIIGFIIFIVSIFMLNIVGVLLGVGLLIGANSSENKRVKREKEQDYQRKQLNELIRLQKLANVK